MIFSPAPEKYSRTAMEDLLWELRHADTLNRKRGQNIVLAQTEKLILYSPDGSKWALSVDNSGVLTAVAA